MFDFTKMRDEHNPYTIGHLEVSTGEIYSSDQDMLHQKWKGYYLDLFPEYLIASDDVVIDQRKKITGTAREYTPHLYKSAQAVRRRYVRTTKKCRDGVRRTNFLVMDHDKPFGHEDWMGKLPTPQLVVINPVSAKRHIVYVLDMLYDVSNDVFQNISKHMVSIVRAERANQSSFRSPFFITGNRKRHESFRKGKRKADYHYVIHHEHGAYSPIDLCDFFLLEEISPEFIWSFTKKQPDPIYT